MIIYPFQSGNLITWRVLSCFPLQLVGKLHITVNGNDLILSCRLIQRSIKSCSSKTNSKKQLIWHCRQKLLTALSFYHFWWAKTVSLKSLIPNQHPHSSHTGVLNNHFTVTHLLAAFFHPYSLTVCFTFQHASVTVTAHVWTAACVSSVATSPPVRTARAACQVTTETRPMAANARVSAAPPLTFIYFAHTRNPASSCNHFPLTQCTVPGCVAPT